MGSRDWVQFWRNAIVAAIACCLLIFYAGSGQTQVEPKPTEFPPFQQTEAEARENLENSPLLPPLQAHPLPPQLLLWDDPNLTGDYFDAVKPTRVAGYLIWSQFPVTVYIERPPDESDRRFQGWFNAVETAVAEWNVYLPLKRVEDRETADIICLRSRPPLRATLNRQTRTFEFPTARHAEASYEFYLRSSDRPILSHRFTLQLSPNQTDEYTLATARHELGHALGIWGHSPSETDALYATQTNNPPQISARDVNTLKKVYQQPTRLGWAIEYSGSRARDVQNIQ